MRRLPWRLASDELRVTGVEMERASPRGMTGKKASAPLPSAAPPPSPAGEGKNLWAHMLLACHPERAQRAEGSLKIKPSLSSRASVEGSCVEQLPVPNTAKEFVTDTLTRKTRSTARLAFPLAAPLRVTRVGSKPTHSYLFGHPE